MIPFAPSPGRMGCLTCNIGGAVPARIPVLSIQPRARLVKARTAQPGGQPGNSSSSNSRQSPTSSVSDAFVSFFDDLTRGSVSIDEEDDVAAAAAAGKNPPTAGSTTAATAAAATAAANAAAATAGAAARAAAGAGGLAAAGKNWEGAALTALTAAVAEAGEASSSSRDGSSGSSGSSNKAGAVRSLEVFAASAQQELAVGGSSSSSSSDGSKLQGKAGDSSSSSSSTGGSRQAVTQEAVRGAPGELQVAALSLTDADGMGDVSVGAVAGWLAKGLIGVGVLQAFKSGVEAAMQQIDVSSIPPAVVSMLAVPLLLSVTGASTADRVVGFYDACIAPWTTDLLGLFYVPAVAILPVLLRGMQGADLAGLLGVAALSTAATLLLTTAAAKAWAAPQPAAAAAAGGGDGHGGFRLTSGPAAPLLLSFTFLAAAGPLAATRFDPLRFGAAMALPVGFAWSLLGFAAVQVYMQQQQREKGGKTGWLSPLLAGAVAANVGVAWHASIMGWGHLGGLSRFYAGEVLGAGEVLVAPLGVALTALGFLIYKHRAALALPGIAATAALSAAFSVATSVAAAKLIGVSTDWARAFIPRSVTGSTASHFAAAIGAPAECAGLVVLLQAAFTVTLGASIFKVAHRRTGPPLSPAAAGTAVGVTAGAMGLAGVCGGDEVALASGAVAYGCMVLLGSVLSSVPSVAAGLAALVA